jgi:hypothetical protein
MIPIWRERSYLFKPCSLAQGEICECSGFAFSNEILSRLMEPSALQSKEGGTLTAIEMETRKATLVNDKQR